MHFHLALDRHVLKGREPILSHIATSTVELFIRTSGVIGHTFEGSDAKL